MSETNNNAEVPPARTPPTTQETNNNDEVRAPRINIRRGYNNDMSSSAALRQFRGETPDIDAVLCLSTERIDKNVPFEIFQKKIKNYVLKEFKRAEDIV